MTTSNARDVTEVIGIYHAHGGAIGEAKYVIGKFLGTAHCALCDITHSPIRRKPAWDTMVATLGAPVTLLHLNEMPPDVAATVAESGSPVVLARLRCDNLAVLLGPTELDGLGGSVDAFRDAITDAVRHHGWALGSPVR